MSTDLLPLWVTSRPLPIGGIAILCIVVAAANALLVDFLETFLKRPKHFPKEPWWKSLLAKRARADVPVIEVDEGGDYREALARGSKLVSFPQYPLDTKRWKKETSLVPNPEQIVPRQTLQNPTFPRRDRHCPAQLHRHHQKHARIETQLPAGII